MRPVNRQMASCFLTLSQKSDWSYPSQLEGEIGYWLGGQEYIFDIVDFRTKDKARGSG